MIALARRALTATFVGALMLGGLARGAHAQSADAGDAERLYGEGSVLLAKGDLAQACPKLEESQRIDPAPGAALALGLCREREGKLASAIAAYDVAGRLARAAGDDERASAAEARALSLRPRVPRVEIALAPSLRSRGPFVLVLDGEVVGSAVATRTTLETDAGRHLVEARAGDLATAAASFEAHDGAIVAVEIVPREAGTGAPPAPPVAASTSHPPRDASPPDGRWTTTRVVGVGALGVGLVAVGVGVAFAFVGADEADELDRLGYDGAQGTCRIDLPACQSSFDAAGTAADASAALWIAGGALVAAGVTLVVWGGGDDGDGATGAALTAAPGGVFLRGRY